jgi:magnesium transporter
MMRSIFFPPDQKPVRNLTVDQFEDCVAQPDGLLWVILEEASPAEIQAILSDVFHFHPLTIEDCINAGYQTPKIDDFGDYLFLIAHAIRPGAEIKEETVKELDLFLGPNYVVTLSPESNMPPVDKTWALLEKDQRIHQGGSDFLCHAILDILVDDYMQLIDRM